MKGKIFVRIGNSSVEMMVGRRVLRFSQSDFSNFLKELNRFKRAELWFASVVPSLTKRLQQKCRALKMKSVEIKSKDVPIQLPYTKTLGVDRALNVFALSFHTQKSFVLVDLGTATTVEFYDGRRGYLGGWIAPGISMMAEALNEKTAQLPRVNLDKLNQLKSKFGRGTQESLLLGLNHFVLGILNQAEATAQHLFGKSKFTLYLTGGGALHYRKLARWKKVSSLQLEALQKMAENE